MAEFFSGMSVAFCPKSTKCGMSSISLIIC
jgi:hypothetical protein